MLPQSQRWLDHLYQHVRYALRGFRRNPLFTVAVIATIALGMGSTTAVFSVVDRILFRSLPYSDENRLVSVGLLVPADTNEFLPGEDYWKWRTNQTAFESMTGFAAGSTGTFSDNCDLADANPVRLNCAFVDSTFLSTFGLHPFLGRDFSDADTNVAYPKVALASYSLWKTHFSGADDVVGKTADLDGHPVTIIGVLPATFETPTLISVDLLVPLTRSSGVFVRAFGRLKPGTNISQAKQALEPLYQDALKYSLVGAGSFAKEKIHLEVRTLRDRQVQDSRTASYVLLAAVLLVFLIACSNVANLLLARASARDREFAVRRALGAGRARIVRQSLTESLILSFTGAAFGLLVSDAALRIFVTLAPQGIPRLTDASVDARVLLFAITSAIFAGVVFGIVPNLYSPGSDVLRSRGATIARSRIRQLLVVGQVALSIVLLSGSVLLMRTLWNLERVTLGMNPENVTAVSLRLPSGRYTKPQQQFAFFEELERRLQESADLGTYAITDRMPLGELGGMSFSIIHVDGRPDVAPTVGGSVRFRFITPQYFSVLGVPLLHGRFFNETDRRPGPASVILSEALAQRLFPSSDAIGGHVRFSDEKNWMTVVGVVGNVKNNPSLAGADDPEWYFPKTNDFVGASPLQLFRADSAVVLLHASAATTAPADSFRKLLAGLDPALPISVENLPQRVARLSDRPRFTAALLSTFAIAAVLLAAVGLSGILSFFVVQRTQEIGVRMALGANAQSVVRLILGYALRWTALGIAIGIALSLITARTLRTMLFEVPERDPWTLAVSAAVLIGVALLAAWLPSHRAARIDPMVALRHD